MPRLRNKTTGVIVNVDAETAARLGSSEWAPATADKRPASGKPAPAKSQSK
ncbi:hypothetical protein [Rathayibacter sp. AY1B8]|uniref:DUF7302 family protein n=1 Tax=Rathayibacter sp. AY1B8 TaxID=2080533 RepID=UPI0015E3665F|nr:hypothetical protein [Rathayibacter sp. AY1B8]